MDRFIHLALHLHRSAKRSAKARSRPSKRTRSSAASRASASAWLPFANRRSVPATPVLHRNGMSGRRRRRALFRTPGEAARTEARPGGEFDSTHDRPLLRRHGTKPTIALISEDALVREGALSRAPAAYRFRGTPIRDQPRDDRVESHLAISHEQARPIFYVFFWGSRLPCGRSTSSNRSWRSGARYKSPAIRSTGASSIRRCD